MTYKIQKIIRIRPKAYEIYKYLEYKYLKAHDSYNNLFNDIIDYSLSYVKKNSLYFQIKDYEERRIVKGFTLKKSLLDKFNDFHVKNVHLQIAELVEIFIYIYALKVLTSKEIEELNIDYIEDGFTKIYR